MGLEDIFKKVEKSLGNLNLDGIFDGVLPKGDIPQRSDKSKGDLIDQGSWSASELRSVARQLALLNRRVENPPTTIGISPFKNAIERLISLRRIDIEYGRMAFIRHEDTRFELGKTCIAEGSKLKIEPVLPIETEAYSTKRTPFATIRTAAYAPSCDPSEVFHFQREDIIDFLRVKSINLALSVASGITVGLLKTSKTPELSPTLQAEIQDRYENGSQELNHNPAKRNLRITSQLARELSIALYVVDNQENCTEARIVKWG